MSETISFQHVTWFKIYKDFCIIINIAYRFLRIRVTTGSFFLLCYRKWLNSNLYASIPEGNYSDLLM